MNSAAPYLLKEGEEERESTQKDRVKKKMECIGTHVGACTKEHNMETQQYVGSLCTLPSLPILCVNFSFFNFCLRTFLQQSEHRLRK